VPVRMRAQGGPMPSQSAASQSAASRCATSQSGQSRQRLHLPALVALLLLSVVLGGSTSARAAEVSGDDDLDAFIGTGAGLLLDSSFSGGDSARQRIATCPGCRWSLQPHCGEDNSFCLARRIDCPTGTQEMTVWFAEAGEPLRLRGTTCIGPAGPRMAQDVATEVADRVVTHVPALAPSVRPSPVLAQVPARVSSGQPAVMGARTMTLAGATVTLDASAVWIWTWGDGSTTSTSKPTLTRQWPRAGRHTVAVKARWSGWFTVDGLGPFPAGGSKVEQEAVVQIDVRPARSVLVRGK
jgi:hypothetical protein